MFSCAHHFPSDAKRQKQSSGCYEQAKNILFALQAFFKDLNPMRAELIKIKSTGIYQGQVLPKSQLENMDKRFQDVASK